MPGRYVDFDKLDRLINRERCKPARADKSIDWSRGFNYCCDLMSREIRTMIVDQVERPIMPGDGVECLRDLNDRGGHLTKGSIHVVHAVSKDMLSLRNVEKWWGLADFCRVGHSKLLEPVKVDVGPSEAVSVADCFSSGCRAALPLHGHESVGPIVVGIEPIQLPVGPAVYQTVMAQSRIINGEPASKREAADRLRKTALDGQRREPQMEVREFSTEQEARKHGRDVARQSMIEPLRQPAAFSDGAIPLTDEWERIDSGDTLREGDMINFGRDPKNGLKPISRDCYGKTLFHGGEYAHFYRRKEVASAVRMARTFAVVGDHMDKTARSVSTLVQRGDWIAFPIDGFECPVEPNQRVLLKLWRPEAGERETEDPQVAKNIVWDNKRRSRRIIGYKLIGESSSKLGNCHHHATAQGVEVPTKQGEHASLPTWTSQVDAYGNPLLSDEVPQSDQSINVGEGWRLLGKNEPVEEGDEFLSDDKIWEPSDNWRYERRMQGNSPYRRRVKPPEPAKQGEHAPVGEWVAVNRGANQWPSGRLDIRTTDGREFFDYEPTENDWELITHYRQATKQEPRVIDPTLEPEAGNLLENYFVLKDDEKSAYADTGVCYYSPRQRKSNDGVEFIQIGGVFLRKDRFRQATRAEVFNWRWQVEAANTKEPTAEDLNIDSGTDQFELARSLHRVVRAMHDGHCPSCGHLGASVDFSQYESDSNEFKHVCPSCNFTVTTEEAHEALNMFLPYMQKNHLNFVKWQASRKNH